MSSVMLDCKWTYFDVLEREGDEQSPIVFHDTSVESQTQAGYAKRDYWASVFVQRDSRKVFDVNSQELKVYEFRQRQL